MSDPETLAIYDAKAAEYAKLTRNAAREPDMIRFMDALPPRSVVLDLGCGPGTHAATLASDCMSVEAWDASAEMVALAAQNAGVTARHASFDDLNSVDHYHGIWANFSLLHADPDKFDRHLEQISTALKPGGVFHIGMKTGTGTARDGLGRRYTYVQPDDLKARLADVELITLAQSTGSDLGLDGVMADWVTLLARKSGGAE